MNMTNPAPSVLTHGGDSDTAISSTIKTHSEVLGAQHQTVLNSNRRDVAPQRHLHYEGVSETLADKLLATITITCEDSSGVFFRQEMTKVPKSELYEEGANTPSIDLIGRAIGRAVDNVEDEQEYPKVLHSTKNGGTRVVNSPEEETEVLKDTEWSVTPLEKYRDEEGKEAHRIFVVKKDESAPTLTPAPEVPAES